MAIKTLKTETLLKKLLLAAFGIICLAILLVASKWLFGNSISTQAENKEVAQFAVAMAPDDPQTHFALAIMNERSFLPEDVPKSLVEYEKAAGLSPYDYRLWLSLGKAKERNGDVAGAEKALQRAILLAPHNSQARWAFGNVLLRQGKSAEAFKEIRAAVDGDPKFASPAATTAWQILGGDIKKVRQTIGDSPYVNAALAVFLARQKRFDEALEIWNALPKERLKDDFREDGEIIARFLLNSRRFKMSLLVQSQISSQGEQVFKLETVTNGGFESNVKSNNTNLFDWKIGAGGEPQINIAGDQKRSGSRSLVLNFDSTKRDQFREISQTIAVNGGQTYRFEVFYKSDLDSDATMIWEIVDTHTGQILASTDPFEQKADWARISASFEVPEESEGIRIRLVRNGCESSVCPLKGRIWMDDIAVTRSSE